MGNYSNVLMYIILVFCLIDSLTLKTIIVVDTMLESCIIMKVQSYLLNGMKIFSLFLVNLFCRLKKLCLLV